jgi:hypothetical protein
MPSTKAAGGRDLQWCASEGCQGSRPVKVTRRSLKVPLLPTMLDISTQKLVLFHAGGGTGKTFVTCKIFEELARRNEICRCTCPTGVGASHLPHGQTFHSVFKTWTPSLSAGTAIDEIFKSLGENQLKLVVVDAC